MGVGDLLPDGVVEDYGLLGGVTSGGFDFDVPDGREGGESAGVRADVTEDDVAVEGFVLHGELGEVGTTEGDALLRLAAGAAQSQRNDANDGQNTFGLD